jgi:hypothetical protein
LTDSSATNDITSDRITFISHVEKCSAVVCYFFYHNVATPHQVIYMKVWIFRKSVL